MLAIGAIMKTLGKCDLCDKEARWAVVVKGCSEHKVALKHAVDNATDNSDYMIVLQSTLNYYHSHNFDKKFIATIMERFKQNLNINRQEQLDEGIQ
jgi:hypothetical protein